MSIDPESNTDLSHHIRFSYCRNRSLYRKSKKLTAVKTYTVASESRHLLVFGVPQINLLKELKSEFCRYGTLQRIHNVTESIKTSGNIEIEAFTDVFHVTFDKLEQARRAKKFLDAKNFYGGILHVSYAPEKETVEELRKKLDQRIREVAYRIKQNKQQESQKAAILKRESSVKLDDSMPVKRLKTV